MYLIAYILAQFVSTIFLTLPPLPTRQLKNNLADKWARRLAKPPGYGSLFMRPEAGSNVKEYKEEIMTERTGVITFKGNPFTLLGPALKVGDKAPAFTVVANDLAPVTLATYAGKVKIISAVPSLDTPVCDMETRTFNQKAAELPDNVVVLTISQDLPFAQKRWCGAAGIDRVITLSDYQERSFAQAFGVLIKELKLCTRAIFIVDASDTIRYIQIVPEVTSEPDYSAVLAAAKQLL
jgi:thioredoxin-dependent peroxiredoxin